MLELSLFKQRINVQNIKCIYLYPIVLEVPRELMLRLSGCSSFGEWISISGNVTFQLGLIPGPACRSVIMTGSLPKFKAGGRVAFLVFKEDFLVKPAAECKAGFKITVFPPPPERPAGDGCISNAEDVVSRGSEVEPFNFRNCKIMSRLFFKVEIQKLLKLANCNWYLKIRV